MEALKNRRRESRRYNGNPLAYFISNFDLYVGMNRSRLSGSDPGLYKALGRAGQLEKAIPEANELSVELGRKVGKGEIDLSESVIEKIIKAYHLYKGNAAEAARSLKHGCSTVIRHWRNAGLKIQKRGSRLPENEIEKIIKAYQIYHKNATEAARHLYHSPSAIIRHWRNAGLKIQKMGSRLPENEIKEIVKAYQTYDRNAEEAARHLSRKGDTIIKYWRKAGLKIRKPGRPNKK